jgi:hypothetical protein
MDDRRRQLETAALLTLGIAPFFFNGLYNPPLAAHDRGWFWIVDIATWIVLPALLLLMGRHRGLFSAADLGLRASVRQRESPWALFLLVPAVAFVMVQLDVAAAHWAANALTEGWPHPRFNYGDVIPPPGPQTGSLQLLAITHLCVTAGVVEELYYRAVFHRLFAPTGWMSAIGYVLASSVVFAGVHWEGGLPRVVEAFVVGVFAALFFRLMRNVWPLIIGHVVTDWYWFGIPGAG